MAIALAFFDLPRELRDVVYEHYVTIDGGYILNAESGKLRAATPRAHIFGLQRTCKRAAREMDGLPLSCNPVTFSTIGNMRESAFRFDFMLDIFLTAMAEDYDRAVERDDTDNMPLSFSFPDSVRESIARVFPQFVPAVDVIDPQVWRRLQTWDSPELHTKCIDVEPSLQREYLSFVMQQLAEASHPCIEYPGVYHLGLRRGRDSMDEWLIPSEQELDNMATRLRPTQGALEEQYRTPVIEFDGIWQRNRFIYRFSAAAAAVQFLNRHPSSRIHLRRIILDEDREAVCFPESHGKGLIPFCIENTRLRVERRVNLWTNLFPAVTRVSRTISAVRYRMRGVDTSDHRAESYLQMGEEIYEGGWLLEEGINIESLSVCVAQWIREAAVLPSNISLLFDGGPAPEQASNIFERGVVERAIWQNALEESSARGLLPDPGPVYSLAWWGWVYFESAAHQGFVCSGFPRMVQELIARCGPVRCNFPVGAFWERDVEQVIWTNRDCTPEGWVRKVSERRDMHLRFQTAPPLPEFLAILEKDLIPRADAEDTASNATGLEGTRRE